MSDIEFNLLHEPWIFAMKNDGAVEMLSITSIFEQAHTIHSISGELPTQDMAIFRLLLAILYAADSHSEGGMDFNDPEQILDSWFSTWNKGQFDIDKIRSYLSRYEDRFYLFHPQRPFYQANIDKGTEYDTSKLIGDISESNNKPRLFSSRGEKIKKQLEYAEAARWLLHINSFDDSSNKPTTRGANFPSIGVGWLGKLGLISIQGNNLFETLMLNYVLLDRNEDPFPDGETIWERNEVCVEERRKISVPESPMELLTLQSRRMLLIRDGSVVTGFKSIGGDVFPSENALIEQMTLWKSDDDGWMPKRHDISREMWRDYSAIISSNSDVMEPGVIRWVSYLKNHDLEYKTLRLRIVGMVYGSKNSSVEDVFEDSIFINADLLAAIGKIWNVRIEKNLELTDKCVKELGNFAFNLSYACKNSKDNYTQVSNSARRTAYYNLDQPFRRWLFHIDPNDLGSLNDKMNEWLDITKKEIIRIGKQILDESSETALVGRDMHNNAMNLFGLFNYKIYKIIGGDADNKI